MKKSIFLVLALVLGTANMVHGINKETMTDTLTQVVNSYARVGGVKIKSIRVKNNHAYVYTNQTLGQVSLSPEQLEEMRSTLGEMIFKHKKGHVYIYSNNVELGKLVTSVYVPRDAKDKYTLPEVAAWVKNESAAYETEQGLAGKHIALWGSHGRYYNQQQKTWLWQRAKLWTTVEDLYTSSYTMPFLVPMLENAGAVVVQPRERDTQTVEQICDEQLGNIAYNEACWTMGEGQGWGAKAQLLEGENPFEMGGYMVATKRAGELKYVPELPAGDYAVYVSYKTLKNSTDQAKYTVVHKGQKTEYSVNQQMGGSTWVYLGTFSFGTEADENYVSLSGVSEKQMVVTADAVKFGGGMGSVARYPQPDAVENTPSSKTITLRETSVDSAALAANQALAQTSGMARYLEASRYWLQYAGIPDSVYNYTSSRNDYTDDYCSRGMWVNYLAGGSAANPDEAGLGVPLHLSLSFHTDAGTRYDGSIVGSLMIYTDHDNTKSKVYPTGVSRQVARDYGDFMQTQIVEDMQALFAPQWERRQLNNSSYAEARYPKVPAVLLELLSHQNYYDMQFGLDPRVRFVISRAIYKGMLRFVHEQYGTEYVVQPLPVRGMQMQREGDELCVSWQAREDRLEPTAVPCYYVVYTRQNDGDWDNGVRVEKEEYRFAAEVGVRYDIKVVAGNKGGVSMPSEVLSAYIAPDEKGRVLVLNAFERVSGPEWFADSTYAGIKPASHGVGYGTEIGYIGEQFDYTINHPWITDDECGWGSCFCDQQSTLTKGNTFDYPVEHGKVLAAMGYSYVSANAYAVDSIGDYDAVDVIMGKQKRTILEKDTAFECFTEGLQAALKAYINRGGNVMISGAHIATELHSEADKTFAKEYLHYTLRCDHASKNGGVVVNNLRMAGGEYGFHTRPNASRLHTENAECILPTKDAACVARYKDTDLSAAVAYDGASVGKGKTLSWAFMLESSEEFGAMYEKAMKWMLSE